MFEGEVNLLANPIASVLYGAAAPDDDTGAPTSGRALRRTHRLRRGRYLPVPQAWCGTDGDPCVFVRQLAGWMQESGWSSVAPIEPT